MFKQDLSELCSLIFYWLGGSLEGTLYLLSTSPSGLRLQEIWNNSFSPVNTDKVSARWFATQDLTKPGQKGANKQKHLKAFTMALKLIPFRIKKKNSYQEDHLISWQAVWHPQTKCWQQPTSRWCDVGR